MLSLRAARDQEGFSLVELLVAILILGVVGGVVLTSLVGGMRTTRDAQNRIDAFNELQVAVERMSRELRAADPVQAISADQVQVQVIRDGACTRFTYTRNGTLLDVTRRPMGDVNCATPGTSATTRLVTGIANPAAEPVFRFFTANGLATNVVADVDVIEINLRRAVREQPSVLVATVVNVRNS